MPGLLPSLWGASDNNEAPLHSLHREIDKLFTDFSRNFGMPRIAPTNGEQRETNGYRRSRGLKKKLHREGQ